MKVSEITEQLSYLSPDDDVVVYNERGKITQTIHRMEIAEGKVRMVVRYEKTSDKSKDLGRNKLTKEYDQLRGRYDVLKKKLSEEKKKKPKANAKRTTKTKTKVVTRTRVVVKKAKPRVKTIKKNERLTQPYLEKNEN